MAFPKGKFISFYGILIKKNDFGEGSTILTVLDRETGRLEIASFGSNKEKSTRREALIVSYLISGVCYKKNEESLPSLKEARQEASFDAITSDLNKLSYLFLIFETLDIILQKEEPFGLFGLFLDTIKKMNGQPESEKYCFFFIIKLLKNEGLLPSFIRAEEYQSLLGGSGNNPLNLGNGAIRFIQDIERNESPLFLENKIISPSVINNMIEFISFMIGHNYNRELNSLSLIKSH